MYLKRESYGCNLTQQEDQSKYLLADIRERRDLAQSRRISRRQLVDQCRKPSMTYKFLPHHLPPDRTGYGSGCAHGAHLQRPALFRTCADDGGLRADFVKAENCVGDLLITDRINKQLFF